MLNEVAPPGFGHTKSGDGDKKGGTAAAFKRALDDGRFKGLPGSTTKKEKTADMFKLMYSMKKKGYKPHYKPGTDEKYKKYQEEVVLEKDLNAAERRALPDSDFALPGKGEGPKGKQAGSYPIPDEKHARSALSLVSQHGTPEEKATVRAKVKKKFPDIQQESMGGGVPLTPQELEIQKKMSRLNVRLARKRSQEMQKAKIKDTEVAPEQVKEGAAWTKKAGKKESGGLNEKGRKSYERENPGSDLKAPSKKPGNKRRASFCARMKGMKRKLTSAKTARDPDSRINKSLRAWNC